MLIELAEFSQKLQEYRAILERLRSEQQSYQQRRERLSKLSQRRRSEIRKPDVACYMCNANIEVEDTNSFATCRGCERLVCRSEEKQCCEWIPAIGIWECRNCHSSRVIQQKAGEWLLNQLTSRLQNPGPVNLNSEGLLGLSAADSDDARSTTSSISSNQKVKVREFVEELLSSMLNGPLDDVSVGQLMENESYLPLIEGQTEPSSPSDTHFELRKMLQKILDEVAKLPGLLNHSGFPLRPEEHLPYFSPKKYEQLLATAVLNKVVEDYRNPKNFEHVKPEADKAGPPTTGSTSAGSAPATGTTFDINHNKVPGQSPLNEANLRKMSLDELKEDLYGRSLSESDESYLSDYIQKHTVPLPDLSDTTGSGSGPEDDVISLKSNTTDGTWEENWLFKKRQLKATESSIAMLVPSPTEEVKALIGDKNADEISDLSEAGSDVEEYDSDSNAKNAVTSDTNSSSKKTGNSLDDHVQDSLISINSIGSNEPVLSEAKNDFLLKEQPPNKDEVHNNLVDDLISIEPCSIKTETANPTLVDSKLNSFLSGPESVLIEENNNVVKQDEVETDDIKLMQERIQNAPKQRDADGNVLYPIGVARTIPVDGHSTECDRKEVPIDRAQSEPEQEKPSETTNGHELTVTINGNSDDSDELLIPGSIAEREHLKWRNASPIANNPYSPDVLQKRLEDSNRKSSMFDFDRLAGRDPTSPTLEVPDDVDPVVASKEEDDSGEKDRSLQSVLGTNPNQYQRYGRDYYINDAKRACGTRKQTPDLPSQLTHSTDDEKSLLLSQKQEQPTSPTASQVQDDQQSTGVFPFVKSSSCGNVLNKNQSEDIFSAARPIEVTPGDPILKKGTKVECLSTPTREVYLVPADEPTTPRSLGSSSELSMTSRADDSLTYSEDSDVTRIYEIGTCESKMIHGDAIGGEKDTGQTPPSTPTNEKQRVDSSHPIDEEQTMNKLNTLKQLESEVLSEEILEIIPQVRVPTPIEQEPIPEEPSSPTIDRSHLLKPHLLKAKPLSPETIKFFSPKKPFTANLAASSSLSQSSMEIRDLPHHSPSHYHSSLHIDYPPTRPAPTHHDFIIEKEVMEVLPSVKELAKCYSGSQQDVSEVPRPLHKPKDFIRQSSDMLHEEQAQETRSGMPHVQNKNRRMYCSTSSITAAEEIRESRRMHVEAYNPPTFVPMAPGHSITARSLSKQIREELKINATDDHKVQGGHTSPERPSSPVFAPGHLRSSIQFFENLRKK